MTGPPTPTATRLSQLLAIVGALGIGAVGTARFLQDGSFWIDEASIALNLLHRAPLDLFAALEFNQNFPRLYLLAIKGLQQAFGFGAIVIQDEEEDDAVAETQYGAMLSDDPIESTSTPMYVPKIAEERKPVRKSVPVCSSVRPCSA